GKGKLALTGRASWAERQYDLSVSAADLPVESLVAFYRRTKLNVSDDLRAAGTAKGELRVRSDVPCVTGNLRLDDVRIADPSHKLDLALGNVVIASPPARSRFMAPTSCLTSTTIPITLGGKDPLQLKMDWQPKQFAVTLNGPAESEQL